MAGNSVIGALRVNLGLDSAQFNAGLKQAQGSLKGFGLAAAAGLAAVAAAAVTVGIAIGKAVDSAIDKADHFNDLAQSAGVGVEALSRLAYASQFADVTADQMAGGLGKLSRAIIDSTTNATGPAATAFAALGISVRDAIGHLKGSDQVFSEIAAKFAEMPDGATKTALAISLLGKSGAELIPVLNMGADGLARMADESDRAGLTISSTTAAAAGEFNDTLDRLGGLLQGVVLKLTEALLPALQTIADAIYDLASDPDDLQGFLNGIVDVFKLIVTAGVVVVQTFKAIGDGLNTLMTAASIAQSGFQNWPLAFEVLKNGFKGIEDQASGAIDFVNKLWTTVDTGPKNGGALAWAGITLPGKGKPADDNTPLIPDLGGGLAAANKLAEEAKAIFDRTRTASEAYAIEVEHLNGLLAAGAIDQDTYNRAVTQAQDAFQAADENAKRWKETMDAVSGSISSALGGFIKDTIKGEDAVSGLISSVGNLGDKLIQMAADMAIQALFKNIAGIFGSALGGGIGGGGRLGLGLTGPNVYGGSGGFIPGITGPSLSIGAGLGGSASAGMVRVMVDDDMKLRAVYEDATEQRLDKFSRLEAPRLIRHHAGTSLAENG